MGPILLLSAAALPSFAPTLSAETVIAGPRNWHRFDNIDALARVARSSPHTRQEARWSLALQYLAAGRSAEAYGVLAVMGQDDPDLALVDAYQLAVGRALVTLERWEEGYRALDRPGLSLNAEACAWRVRALAGLQVPGAAVHQVGCAGAALAARPSRQRTPFLLAAAASAVALNRPDVALRWLGHAPASEPAVALAIADAYRRLRRWPEARVGFARLLKRGPAEQRWGARLGLVQLGLDNGTLKPAAAVRELDAIRLGWRGGPVERDALWLSYRLAATAGDDRRALAAGATIVRYLPLGPTIPPLMTELQARLAALLANDNNMPVARAAGLYWDYRDLSPIGAAGDLLATRLADRLQAEGLYARAADLLEHQLLKRAVDVAQGPLSVRVASLHILARQPQRALAALKASSATVYPDAMIWDRLRIEAVALQLTGRSQEALATIQDVPGSEALRQELIWKQRDWTAMAGLPLPPSRARTMSDAEQVIILRRVIACAMLGREEELRRLSELYGPAFSGLPTRDVFAILTGPAESLTPTRISEALASIPAHAAGDPILYLLEP